MSTNSRDSESFAVSLQPTRLETTQEPASVFPACIALILALVLHVLVLAQISLPVFRPAVGFWFMIILPSYLLFTTSVWRRCGPEERLGYSVCTALFILMLTGLAINELLPLVTVQRPLDAYGILIIGDIINLSLYVFRRRYSERIRLRVWFSSVDKRELRLLVLSLLSVGLAILGVNRLNNGAGEQIALLALVLITLTIVVSVRWINFVRESLISVVIYSISLSLLLGTSLRGWYVTGHDIQQEYRVFQLTEAHGHWSMNYFHNAYNACLSITILPTELGQIIDVDNPYVYKLFFQLIFALCPVLVYGVSKRYFGRSRSVLSAAYFMAFPTFFTDLPFLNRQEIGLLFVATGVLAATNPIWRFRRRQLTVCIAGIGIELSHYSSMYVFLGILMIAWLCCSGGRLVTGSRRAWRNVRDWKIRWAPGAGITVTIGVIFTLASIIFLWGGLATRTSGQVLNDSQYAISAGEFSFKLSTTQTSPPSVLLQKFREDTLKARNGPQESLYLPASAVTKASTPAVIQNTRPLTRIGRDLSILGVPVISLNSLGRNVVALCYELFLAIGLLRLLIVGRQRPRRIGQQLFWLSVGSVAMIGVVTVIPSLKAEYGPLRAFQEGLIIFAPVVVIGSMTFFEPLGRRAVEIAAVVIFLGIFIYTSTLLPQILGGNLAELNLNNNGIYYDLYYTNAEDQSAVMWLGSQPDVLASPIQSTYIQTRFMFTALSSVTGSEVIADAYPTLVRRASWLILSGTAVSSAYTFTHSNGALLEYKYPTELLNNYKNLVYTNGDVVIYK
jgi:uncharacterized membrane protein